MIRKLKLIKTNYFPLVLVWFIFNIGPLAFIATIYIDFSALESSINDLIRLIVLYLFTYGINYLIAVFYFSLGAVSLKSGLKQSILHLFSIVGTAIVLFILGGLAFAFEIKPKILVILLVGMEIIIFLVHLLMKIIQDRRSPK